MLWLSEYDDLSREWHSPENVCAEERSFAVSFFSFLGTTDLEGQLVHIERSAAKARENLQTATERRKRLAGVYAMTGVCAGLCSGLVML